MSSHSAKVCLLGNSHVGKSSIALRFVEDRFDSKLQNTIGAAFLTSYAVSEQGTSFKLQIWDTAGQERYKSLAPMYYRGASAVLIVFDLTNRETLNGVKYWIGELRENGPPQAVLAMVGNKLDFASGEREVEKEEAEKYAASIGAFYAETSARTGENVAQLFKDLCSRLEKRNHYVDVPIEIDAASDQPRRVSGWRFGLAHNDWLQREPRATLQLHDGNNQSRKSCCSS